MRAWKAGLAPPLEKRKPLSYAGLDLADGGANKCSLTIRAGPVVEYRDRWPGVTGDLRPAAVRAHQGREGVRATRGALCTATRRHQGMQAELMRVQTAAQDGSESTASSRRGSAQAVYGPDIEYEKGRPNKHVFARLNIQMADNLRLRANRTVRLLNGDKTIDPMTCLFIP